MKVLLIVAMLASALISNGQPDANKNAIAHWDPLVYVDSLKLSYDQFQLLYFNPDKISNIDLNNNYFDSGNHVRGKIFIKTKNPKELNLLSLSDIEKMYSLSETRTTIFMVDNDFIRDLEKCRVDSSYIWKVEILNSNDFEYLKNNDPELTIVKIKTRCKENMSKETQFPITRIR